MKVIYDISKAYESILPVKQNNNTDNIDWVKSKQTILESVEKEVIKNFGNNLIYYSKDYLTREDINFNEDEKKLLKNKIYGEWFYKSVLYNQVKLQTDNCCYCYIGPVDELDHFFNKNDHPELSISNVNLIPSCTNCNKTKSQTAVYIQPYYEDISLYQWLNCDLNWENSLKRPIPVFSIVQPKGMTDEMYGRLEIQLPQKKIIDVLTKKATDHISAEWSTWQYTFNFANKVDFKIILKNGADEKEKVYGINSWQYQISANLYKDKAEFFQHLKDDI